MSPYIETSGELAEWLADQVGVYGAHDVNCTELRLCRGCWTSDVAQRIRDAARNDAVIHRASEPEKAGENG